MLQKSWQRIEFGGLSVSNSFTIQKLISANSYNINSVWIGTMHGSIAGHAAMHRCSTHYTNYQATGLCCSYQHMHAALALALGIILHQHAYTEGSYMQGMWDLYQTIIQHAVIYILFKVFTGYIIIICKLIYNSVDCQVSKVLHKALNFFIITTQVTSSLPNNRKKVNCYWGYNYNVLLLCQEKGGNGMARRGQSSSLWSSVILELKRMLNFPHFQTTFQLQSTPAPLSDLWPNKFMCEIYLCELCKPSAGHINLYRINVYCTMRYNAQDTRTQIKMA